MSFISLVPAKQNYFTTSFSYPKWFKNLKSTMIFVMKAKFGASYIKTLAEEVAKYISSKYPNPALKCQNVMLKVPKFGAIKFIACPCVETMLLIIILILNVR